MRSDTVYKRHYNGFLSLLARIGTGARLSSERQLAAELGCSRTTLRKALDNATRERLISDDRVVLHLAAPDLHFQASEIVAPTALVERKFLSWILQSDSQPGQLINVSQLARQFGVSTSTIREFLQGFRHYGLLEKRAGGSWIFRGITAEFADELSDIREIFELRAVSRFAQLPDADPAWQELRALYREHQEFLTTIDEDFHRFSLLDERLHRLINSASGNRFVTEFHHVIALIFHYHYQWNKQDERHRNEVAARQHLAYIEAIFARDEQRIAATAMAHLKEARRTFSASIKRGN